MTGTVRARFSARLLWFVAAAIGIAILATTAPRAIAQAPAAGAPPAPASATQPAAGEEMVTFNLPNELQVKVLVQYVTERLNLNLLYTDAVGAKRVTLYAPEQIPASSLLDLFRSVLRLSGFALVDADQPGFMKIVAAKDMLRDAGKLQLDPKLLADAKATTPVMQIFALRHASLDDAAKTIKPFLSQSGGLSFPIPNSRMLLVADYAGNLRRAAAMIEILDKPGPKATITFIDVKHRKATELASQVEGLLTRKRGIESPSGRSASSTWSLSAEPRTNRLILIAPAGVEAEVRTLLDRLDTPLNLVRKTYTFGHVSPERIEKLVRGLTDPAEWSLRYTSTIDAESGRLFATTSPAIHERIAALAAEMDVAPAVTMETYTIRYIAPSRLDKLMRDYVGGERPNLYRATIEEQSGMMMVTATAEVHAQFAWFQKQLDLPHKTGDTGGPVRFYKLRNRAAAEVLATIKAMNSGAGRGGSGDGVKAPPAGKAGTGDERLKLPSYTPSSPAERAAAAEAASGSPSAAQASVAGVAAVRLTDATVTVDTSTNTLIVVAPPAVQATYERLIRMLDKRRPQVMIEVVMVALDTSGGYSLGVEMATGDTTGDNKHLLFSVFGLGQVDVDSASVALSPGIGFNGAVIRGDTFSAVVRAVANSGRAKVVAAPRILVNDAVSATISSTSQAPYTSVNSSDTVAMQSFGGYAAAGTQVSLTPLISEGDHLNLKYSISLSTFSGEGGGGTPPPRQETSLSSEVVIPDGHAVIVGGLTREDFSDTSSKIPLLGDIPVLKYLFGSHTNSESKSTFFVFIRPVILRDDKFEDLKYLSDRDLKLAELPAHYPKSQPLLMR